jgi:hypothetical protein
LDPPPKYLNVAVYDPNWSLFLVALRTKNVPGALGDVAGRLGKAGINILSCSNYSLPGKDESMMTFFAGTLDKNFGTKDLKRAVFPLILSWRHT